MTRRAGLACLALLAACGARPPAPVPLPPADPDALLARVRGDEDRLRTLRARFRSRSKHAGTSRSADGVLLVAKPERFRLRLMLPLGLTIFDYVGREDGVWISLPLHGDGLRSRRGADAPPADLAFFSRESLGAAFLRGAYAFPGSCRAAAVRADEVEVSCARAGESSSRTLRLDPRAATIREETSFADGTPQMIIRYADHRPVESFTLPYRIEIDDPRRGMAVEISIDAYEVNPVLADDLFRPPDGARPLDRAAASSTPRP